MALPTPLEPVPRDERKLRLTALILIGIMVLGAFIVLRAYDVWSEKQSKDDRPAFVGRLEEHKGLVVRRQDGSVADVFVLNGKVNLIHPISISDPESCKLEIDVIRRLLEHYRGNPDFSVISLVIDPGPPSTIVPTLSAAAETLGAELPQWWIASTDPVILHKFLKKEFKASILPKQTESGWDYDATMVLIDRNRHIRQAVVPQKRGGQPFVTGFDFHKAAEWDAKDVLTGTERNNVGQLEHLLIRTIDRLLAEDFTP